jgi:hypothetical protein
MTQGRAGRKKGELLNCETAGSKLSKHAHHYTQSDGKGAGQDMCTRLIRISHFINSFFLFGQNYWLLAQFWNVKKMELHIFKPLRGDKQGLKQSWQEWKKYWSFCEIVDFWPILDKFQKWTCAHLNRCTRITTNQNSSNKHSDYATLVTVSVTDFIARVDSDRSYNSVGLVTVTYLASPGYVVSI